MSDGVPGGSEGAPVLSTPEVLPQAPQAPVVEIPPIGYQEQQMAKTIHQDMQAGVDPDSITRKVAEGIPAEDPPTDSPSLMVVQPEGFQPPNSETSETMDRLAQWKDQQNAEKGHISPETPPPDRLTTWEQTVANNTSLTLDETRELINAKNDPHVDPEQRARMEAVINQQLTLTWRDLGRQLAEAQRNNTFMQGKNPEEVIQALQKRALAHLSSEQQVVLLRKLQNGEQLTPEEQALIGDNLDNLYTLLGGASAKMTTGTR